MHNAKKGEIRPMSTGTPPVHKNGTHLQYYYCIIVVVAPNKQSINQSIFISSQKEGTCAVTHLTKRETDDNCNSGSIYISFH